MIRVGRVKSNKNLTKLGIVLSNNILLMPYVLWNHEVRGKNDLRVSFILSASFFYH